MSSTDLRALGFFENAVEALVRDGIVDPDRVVLSGFSGSTGATAFALTRSAKFTAAIVTTGGSFDAGTCYFAANYRSCEEEARRLGFGWPYDTRDGMLKDSPAWNADRISAPLLMQLPETEYTGMMQLYGALLGYDRAVEMYVFPGAYHYKHNPRQRKAVYDRNVDWINFWLKGVEPVGIGGEGVALRWREMRERQCGTIGNVATAGHTTGHTKWYCRPGLRH
jgi:dipeptidyl aminopeptidase/acylaminoacyl peptidase